MSYILNALRKSEQARKAVQADEQVFIPLLPEQPVTSHKWRNVIWLFLAINLLVLSYMFFKMRAPSLTVAAPPAVVVVAPVAHPDQVQPAPAISTQVLSSVVNNTPAISDLWAESKKAQDAEALKAIVVKPKVVIKKKAAEVVNKESKVLTKAPLEENSAITELAENVAVFQKNEVLAQPPTPAKPAASNSIPLLRELSGDFQAKVPTTTINVLAYADAPQERFVIIDMTKYRIGERIKSKIILLDILPESVVLSYEGQRFRLERP